MTTNICAKLVDLESEIAELNIKLNNEKVDSAFFKMKFNRDKLTANVDKVKKLQSSVSNLINKLEKEINTK
jgi:hypothetical protein